MFAFDYSELDVYKISRNAQNEIFELTKFFPKAETYSLTDQIRRSSRSIGAQIAEAWSRRKYEKHFISKISDATGEQQETRHWIETSIDCGYITREKGNQLLDHYSKIGKMLNSMINKSKLFCQA